MTRKELKDLGFDNDEIREVIDNLRSDEEDFEVGNYRFIHEDSIDEIMQDELGSDEYMLGCFNDWFLSSILDIDIDVIQSMQQCEAYEALGKLVLSLDKLEELQQEYVSADGYGHHFAHYDHHGYEIGDYHIFRVN